MHDSTSREINNKKQSKKGNGTLKTTKIKNSVAQVDREQNSTNLARLDFYFYSYLRTPLFFFLRIFIHVMMWVTVNRACAAAGQPPYIMPVTVHN